MPQETRVQEDPVAFWLSRMDSVTRKTHRSHLSRWLHWLQSQPGWSGTSPREVLVRQLQEEDPYELLDLLQTYVGQLNLRKSSKKKAYCVVKSFFSHNRCALPSDPAFRLRGDKPPVQAKLTVKDVLGSGCPDAPHTYANDHDPNNENNRSRHFPELRSARQTFTISET